MTETIRKPKTRPRSLICCCCGSGTLGRQWWNRDNGFGLCDNCIEFCGVADVPIGKTASSYGVRGLHWDLPESKVQHA